jgi:hypothetical protein
VIFVAGALMLAAYLSAIGLFPKPGGRVVFGDATHHFVQLRSAVFDRDLDFKNEYLTLYGLQHEVPGTEFIFSDLTPTGRVRNYMPVGPALLWAPLYLLIAGSQWLLSLAGLAPAPDGFGRVLQMTPGATGVVAATLATWLSWRLARRWTDPMSAAVGALAVWLGSSAIYYTLASPSYSHTASMFATSAFALHWLTPTREWSIGRAAVSGALAGLASLMRWQDVLLLAVPAWETLRSPLPWSRRALAWGATLLAWAVVFSPQMAVWQSLYGSWLAMPQGPAFLQWSSPHLFDVLFSDNHGLFTWTPLVVLSLIGLATFAATHRQFAWPIAWIVLTAWYVNAAVADWWAGEAFGARRFLSLFPWFVLGLATWIGRGRVPERRVVVVVVIVAATGLLLFQYWLFLKGFTAITPYPKGWFNLWLARFVVPFRWLAHLFA